MLELESLEHMYSRQNTTLSLKTEAIINKNGNNLCFREYTFLKLPVTNNNNNRQTYQNKANNFCTACCLYLDWTANANSLKTTLAAITEMCVVGCRLRWMLRRRFGLFTETCSVVSLCVTDRDAVCVVDSDGSKEACVGWRPDLPQRKRQFGGVPCDAAFRQNSSTNCLIKQCSELRTNFEARLEIEVRNCVQLLAIENVYFAQQWCHSVAADLPWSLWPPWFSRFCTGISL